MSNKSKYSISYGKSDGVIDYYGSMGKRNKSLKDKIEIVKNENNIISESFKNTQGVEVPVEITHNSSENVISSKCSLPKLSHKTVIRKRVVRPTLSEQLASIGARAEEITKTICIQAGLPQKCDDIDPPILVCPSISFHVGNLKCRYPSPVRFYRNRCEYTFHHPYESSEIAMTMFYQDMRQIALRNNPYRFTFRVPKNLTHFKTDYDPKRIDSLISIDFASQYTFDQIKENLKPFLPSTSSAATTR